MTRPDLDAIEAQLKAEGVSYVNQGWAPDQHQRTVDLLTYCRELETENKRLRESGENAEAAALAALHQARALREEMEEDLEMRRAEQP